MGRRPSILGYIKGKVCEQLRNVWGGRKLLAAAGAFALALVGSIGAVSSHAALGDVGNDGAIDADAIAAGVIDNAIQLSNSAGAGKDVISGRAQIVNPRGGGQLTSTYNAFEPVDATIPVYVQWIDRDGAVSPIYRAQTHELPGAAGSGGKGMYAFKLPTWTDHLGQEHRFTTSIYQRYRVFSSAQPVNPKTGNKLSLLRTAPGYTPYAFGKGSGDGLGDWPMSVATNGNMTRTGLWFFEKPEDYVKHANPIEDPKGPLGNPQVHYENDALKTFSGNVWLELGNERQLFTGATLTRDPAPSDGYTVWASTLTAEGKAAYDTHVNSKPEVIQAEAAKELLTQHPEYIAATVYGPVVDGKYTLRFPEDKYEQRYVYMWVEDPDGRVVTAYSTFTQPEFQDPRNNLQWSPAKDPAKNNAGLVGKDFERYYNINFAIVHQDYAELDITNFDNTDNPAHPGEVAKLTLTGNLSPLPSKIEWRGPDGTVVKSCDITSTANLNGCETFEVPADAQNGTFYTAVLVSGDQDVAADSFIVSTETDGDRDDDGVQDGNDRCPNTPAGAKVDENGCSVAPTLDLKPIEGTVGQPIDPVEFTIDNTGKADIVECKVEGLPEGLKAEINAERTACVITGTPTEPIDNGTVTVNVDYQPADSDDPKTITGDTTVTITKPEAGDDDGDGVPNPADPNNPVDGEDKCPNTPAGAKVDENGCSVAPTVTLNPTEIKGKVGQEIDPVVVKINNPGKVEITSCKADGLPAGLVAELNSEGTGCVIHGTPTEEADGKPVTITVDYQPKDSDTPGSVEKNTTATIVKDPKWDDAETTPTEPVEIENTGGKVPDGSTVEVIDGPGTAEISDDGTITVTPNEDAKPGDKIVVEVKDPDGNVIDTVVVEIVKPDPTQADEFEPGYEDGSGKPGEDVTVPAPEFKDEDGNPTTAPEATKFTPGEGAPDGVTIDENTGEITVPIPEGAKPGDKITVPVVVTYPDGSKDNVDVTVTVDEPDAKDNEIYEPAYEGKLVVPGEETKSAPSFTDKDGKDVTAPEGSKFVVGEDFKAPEGYVVEIDENTGVITVTFPDGSKLNKDTVEEFDVPVTVTYPDKSTDDVKANFKLDTDGDGDPDVTDPDDDGDGIPDEDDSNPKVPNANDHFEPGYEDGSGKPGEDVTVPAPEFKDKDGNPTTPPEGTTFGPGEGTPDGVTIDENTGEITVTIPEDAKPGDKITVPVVVTYPDGTKDNTEVTVTVEEPDAKDNEIYEPAYEGKLVVPGQETKSSPTFTDNEGKDAKAPEGSKFSIPEDSAPEGYVVTIDESTGEITVTFPDESKLNKDTVEEFDVPVTVTYPDGSTDKTDANFKLDTDNDGTPDTEDKDDDNDGIPDEEDSNPKVPNANDHFEPGYEDGSGKPGEDVTVPAPEFKDEDGNPTTAPEGTKGTAEGLVDSKTA